MEVHEYSTKRNKSEKGSLKTIKKALLQERGSHCEKCLRYYNALWLELDHILPVMVAGAIFDKNNLQILCRDCHRIKTKVDKQIFQALKWLHLIHKVGVKEYQAYISIPQLHRIYYQFLKLKSNSSITQDAWWSNRIKAKPYNENRNTNGN